MKKYYDLQCKNARLEQCIQLCYNIISLDQDYISTNLFFFQLQEHLLQSYFSIFYFAINLGSLLSMIVTPILRGMLILRLTLFSYFFACTCTCSTLCLQVFLFIHITLANRSLCNCFHDIHIQATCCICHVGFTNLL